MTKVTEAAKNDYSFKQGLMDSLEPVIVKLNNTSVILYCMGNLYTFTMLQMITTFRVLLTFLVFYMMEKKEALDIIEKLQYNNIAKKNDKIKDFISPYPPL